MIQIYHNPRCGKSRDCLLFLEKSGKEYEIIKYLESVPTFQDLSTLLRKLNLKAIDLVRQKEKIWIDHFKNKTMTETEIIEALISNPILIERPIVINGEKAIIARPLEKALSIL